MIIEKNSHQKEAKNRFNWVRNNFLIYDPWAGKLFGGGCEGHRRAFWVILMIVRKIE